MKTHNNSFYKILPLLIILIGFVNSIITDNITLNAFESIPYFNNLQYKIITMPELYISMLILFIYAIIILVLSKKTENSNNKNVKTIRRITDISAVSLAIIFVILSSYTLITTETKDIPHTSDGKFLDIHDLGIDDKITAEGFEYSGTEIQNIITTKTTISAKQTLTKEYYYIGDESFFVYQDIIEYRNEKTAKKAAELLTYDNYEIYSGQLPQNIHTAYTTDEDLITVIDNTVYRISIITQNESLRPSAEDLLQKISFR